MDADARRTALLLDLRPLPWFQNPIARLALGGFVAAPLVALLGESGESLPIAVCLGVGSVAAAVYAAYAHVRLRVSLVRDEAGRAIVVERTSIFGTRSIRRATESEPELVLDTDLGFSFAREPVRMRVYVRIEEHGLVHLEDVTAREREHEFESVRSAFARAAATLPGAFETARAAREEDARRERHVERERAARFEALSEAAENDDVRAVSVLLAKGLGLDERHEGESPLELAALVGARAIVAALLERGATPTARALAVTAWNAPEPEDPAYEAHLAIARLLLTRGVSPDADAGDAGTAREAFGDAGPRFVAMLTDGGTR